MMLKLCSLRTLKETFQFTIKTRCCIFGSTLSVCLCCFFVLNVSTVGGYIFKKESTIWYKCCGTCGVKKWRRGRGLFPRGLPGEFHLNNSVLWRMEGERHTEAETETGRRTQMRVLTPGALYPISPTNIRQQCRVGRQCFIRGFELDHHVLGTAVMPHRHARSMLRGWLVRCSTWPAGRAPPHGEHHFHRTAGHRGSLRTLQLPSPLLWEITSRPTNQPANQPTDQPTDRPTSLTHHKVEQTAGL